MRHHKTPLFKRNEMDRANNQNGLFAIIPIIPQIIIIAIVIACYYYISNTDYFVVWLKYFYYAVKTIIAIEILIGAGKSLTLPLLAVLFGMLNLYFIQANNALVTLSSDNSWHLIIIGGIGIVLTFIVRSFRR